MAMGQITYIAVALQETGIWNPAFLDDWIDIFLEVILSIYLYVLLLDFSQ